MAQRKPSPNPRWVPRDLMDVRRLSNAEHELSLLFSVTSEQMESVNLSKVNAPEIRQSVYVLSCCDDSLSLEVRH